MNHLLDISTAALETKPRLHLARRVLKGFCDSLERARTRRLLAQLDDRHLSDLGISHSDRVNELDQPFWR
ncbi:DUF1127 domain-containing protein [Pseudomonas sp. PD9R]|uniref:DUF1127 domain-containing protein n=1 Tax=Pseudomonas sp. PD9R TaxID=2853534 RepID=UPI001C461FD8|nr:DUF1127 domain-containing protein [Pseudomonas sp. PD9R]MBV6827197.1 DUF1127 domain-containing protein [Pseudomonas sp. PD9R]